ncbi:hypothetical protein [Actinoplanes solisilvae]|uniref:hypothetical protein n=1 Tax=Actinoplanes solisilvae TaxID=2486853 RepID=UPI000FD75AA2|nr:hypothetical protein [Actinoplanes solisilvae]
MQRDFAFKMRAAESTVSPDTPSRSHVDPLAAGEIVAAGRYVWPWRGYGPRRRGSEINEKR